MRTETPSAAAGAAMTAVLPTIIKAANIRFISSSSALCAGIGGQYPKPRLKRG
jgi:hypothetical protein